MLARVAHADEGRISAEQVLAELTTQLEQVRIDSAAAIQKAAQEAAARETAIRAEATIATRAAMQHQLAIAEAAQTAAEQAKAAAEQAMMAAENELRNQFVTASEQMETLKEVHANEIGHQREALEKDKIAAVLAEQAKGFEERQKWQGKVQELQRQIENQTAQERGEGAELKLHEILKAAFEDDRIRRVEKGASGADIIHEVIHNGKVCGKIVYDSKNRNSWKNDYAIKLRQDQIAEKADHAILSSNSFPAGAKQLHRQDGVIIACPARVLALAELLRGHILQMHELRVSNEAREEKTAELYAFITSEHCGQLLDSVETLINKLFAVDVDEQKAHSAVWEKRGRLLKSVLKSHGDLCFEFDRIIGTVDVPE